jgi:hypothetical protein
MFKNKTAGEKTAGFAVIFIFVIYFIIYLLKLTFGDSLIVYMFSILLIVGILLFCILAHFATECSKKRLITSVIMLVAAITCALFGELSLKGFQAVNTESSITILLLPLFAIWSYWLLAHNAEYYRPYYLIGVLSVAGAYVCMAIVTWATGIVGTTEGFSLPATGWYAATAIFGTVLFLTVSSALLCWKRVVLTLCAIILMGTALLLSGSKITILVLIGICCVLLAAMTIQHFIMRTHKFHPALYVVFVVMILTAPFFLEHTSMRTEKEYPVIQPTNGVTLTQPITWQDAITNTDYLGYITYLDKYHLTWLGQNATIDAGAINGALNDYVMARVKTSTRKLARVDIQDTQFLNASIRHASAFQLLFGYGTSWFRDFSSKIDNGFAYLLGCYGVAGTALIGFPIFFFAVIIIRKMSTWRRCFGFQYIAAAAGLAGILGLIYLCGGMVLHPAMMLFLYVPFMILLTSKQPATETAGVERNASMAKPVKRWLAMALFGALVFGILITIVKFDSVTKRLSSFYNSIYRGKTSIAASVSAFSPDSLQPAYQSSAKQPMKKVENNGVNSADDFLKGHYMGYEFGDSIDWDLPGISNPSIQYNYHSMFWLDACVQKWKKTGDIRYIQKAVPIMMSWIKKFPTMRKDNPAFAWGDDSTGRRCFYISEAYVAWSKFLTESQKSIIETSMKYHAQLLAQSSLYTWYHNHGLFRDRALLFYTLTFSNSNNNEYQAITKNRILTYVQVKVLEDGVSAEHSPSYHIAIAKLLYEMADLYKDVDPAYSHLITDHYADKMINYAIQLTRPDGSYPPIGDSGEDFNVIKNWINNPNYLYVATKGSKGNKPTMLDSIYPDGNYAIFRNSWKLNGDADWVMFVAAIHSKIHRHHDDLSFLVWHHGDLLTDAGSGSYDVNGNPMSKYATSPWAHSILVSNWMDTKNSSYYNQIRPVFNSTTNTTRITKWMLNGSNVSVTGVQHTIPGIKQQRCLTWDKISNIVKVTDTVTSTHKKDYHMFLFQLADDIKPVVDGSTVTLNRGSVKEATMMFSSSHAFSIRIYYGDKDKKIQGFDAATGKPRYIVAVYFENVSDKLELQTNIKLLP